MLTITDLTKTYGSHTAVDHLSFDVPDGVVTGFLGPNGSGKSTTMRMCMGLERPTSGTALFDGTSFRELDRPASVAGGLLDATWFHPGRTARDHLAIMARLQGVVPSVQVTEVLEMVGIGKVADKRVGGYSLGMKQRLGLASALLSRPRHLLLDEPVNGLDPAGVHWMRDRIRDYAAQGVAVLVSSHLLSEMQLTADRLVVIGRGRMIGAGTVEEFLGTSGVEVTVDRPAVLADALRPLGFEVTHTGQSLLVEGLDDPRVVGVAALDHNLVISHLGVVTGSLEDAFLAATDDALEYRTTDAPTH